MISKKGPFLLDANIFIQANRQYYSFDICPGFWESLVFHNSGKRLFSIDRVKEELDEGDDDDKLKVWATKVMPPNCFISTDDKAIIKRYREIVRWVNQQTQYREGVVADFMSVADGWLVACAKAKEMVLVTHEVYRPEQRNKVPIPNICKAFDVEYVNSFEMLRTLRVRFHWKAAT